MIDYHLSHLRDLFGSKGNQRGLVALHTKGLIILYDKGVLLIEEPYNKAFKKITDRLKKRSYAWTKKDIGYIEYQILFFALKAIIDENNPNT